ncbi:MAG: nucleoside deaminase [Nigerium sp.]|nr:nucleoside deaminase [Nigerium sp.]
MALALDEARAASAHGDVPVGAVLLDADGAVLARAGNERELTGDPTAHAEVLALRRAASARAADDRGWSFEDCTLVVTLEPCAMCAGALVSARIGRLVFGALDAKAGAVASVFDIVRDPRLNHRVEVVSGVAADSCAAVLREFFARHR